MALAIGGCIRETRCGLPGRPSQEAIARRAGVSLQTMNRAETGARMVEFETLEKIAAALGTSLESLLRSALSDGTGYFEQMAAHLRRSAVAIS